jgi:hypothetical protein
MAEENVKQVVAEPVTPVTKTDSPTEIEAGDSVNYDNIEKELSFNEIEESEIDWPVIEKVEQISEEQAKEVQGEQSQEPAEPVQEEQPVEVPSKEENPLTGGMRDRISKLKQAEGQKLAEKDAQIQDRDSQIKELQSMNEKFSQLTQAYRPPTGDPAKIQEEIQQLENRLDEDGDTMTAAEIHKLGRRQQQLERQIDEIKTAEIQTQNMVQQQRQMRNQYDSYATENYDFVGKPEDEKYQVMKEQAYPLLEQLIPQFQQYPHDMVIAAELSDLIVDAQRYRQLIGDQPNAKRAEPQPMAGNVAPSSRPTKSRKSLSKEIQRVRGGSLEDVAQVLRQAGHGWSAPK